jgi:hypothetical protein
MMARLEQRVAGAKGPQQRGVTQLSQLDNEAWLAKRMLDHCGLDVFDGTTDTNTRKERFREAIKTSGLECVIIGAKDRKPVDWRAAFESLYNEPL